jgi:hypothetical protein
VTKTYIGTKVIKGAPMTRGEYNAYRGWVPPVDEEQNVDGYLVEYTDGGKPNHPDHAGYISWSPADVFEGSYRAVDSGISFGDALLMLMAEKRVARAGWNGKGMFVYRVPPASYPVQTGAAKSHFGEGSMVPYNAYLALKGVDDTVSTWVPSVNDCLAEDWIVLE